jgi:uncharacterized membrane-anchored protein/protein tyrosine phosphatase (PTP) superfamily phosphohydrolase (DUF442 family)
MDHSIRSGLRKVPAVTLAFWIIKIIATTLGETGGDAVSMSLGLGYAISSIIFIAVFFVAVSFQVAAKSYRRVLYWTVIVASTTAGTTMADFADRSLGIGYLGGSAILLTTLLASFFVWQKAAGSISVETVRSPRVEVFYWTAILFSQTLGTALGDWMADTNGMGYQAGALIFAALLTVMVLLYFFTAVSRTLLFWSAFVLTRPLGATLGDFLDKPISHGGLAISRFTISAILVASMVACILIDARKKNPRAGIRVYPASLMSIGYLLRALVFGLVTLIVSAGAFIGWQAVHHNAGIVVPGQLYRSGQLSPAGFSDVVAKYRIKTIVNLRGENKGMAWYDDEVRFCDEHGVGLVNVRMTAKKLPTPAEVRQLLVALHSPQPILVHCNSGSDRTGLACALFLIDQDHDSPTVAADCLTWLHGHFAVYPYFEMNELIDLYAESKSSSFSDWINEDYPAVYADECKESTLVEVFEPIEYFVKDNL